MNVLVLFHDYNEFASYSNHYSQSIKAPFTEQLDVNFAKFSINIDKKINEILNSNKLKRENFLFGVCLLFFLFVLNMNKNDSVIHIISTIQFSCADYAIVISLLIISLLIGVFVAFFHNGGRTTDDFLYGSYKMYSIPVALSLLAR